MTCPFCNKTDRFTAILDEYPISLGHTLIVPKEHIQSFFDLSLLDYERLWSFVWETKDRLQKEYNPDGFNIGFNDGIAAGQTVMHAHIHIIPRYKDDVADPRGGIRWIIPSKAKYWQQPG